ncbi:MAG: hypothetical protein LBP20_01530 [Treponema sp.]|jgi:hypothetical protein|nr:hypothetical protein [Treponema sp.]
MSVKKNEGKTLGVSTVIAALCVMLYLGGLSYGALSIHNSIIERRTLADKEFGNLADLASSAGVLGFMDEPFIKTIQDSIEGSQTVLGVVISSSRGEFAFERERGTVIDWVNDSPRFIRRFAVTNPPKYLPLRIEGQRNVNIQAVCGYIDYDYCTGILKKTLLVVLLSLTLAFFTLLMDTLLTKNREPAGWSPGEKPAPGTSGDTTAAPVNPPEEAPDTDSRAPPTDDNEPDFDADEPDFGSSNTTDEIPDVDDEDLAGRESPVDSEAPDFDGDMLDFDSEAPDFDGEAPDFDSEAPRGLFSPRGGVGWEAYTRERLESELRRCTSGEQDLTLILMTIKEPENLKDEQFRLFCEEAVQYFEHRDLIFEHGEQGISAICPGLGLEQAFARSEEFNNRVLGKFARQGDTKIDLRFGVSSRAGRLINAGQIALEAGEALKRAGKDTESHIVAFKSDPEKYRQHLAAVSGHHSGRA